MGFTGPKSRFGQVTCFFVVVVVFVFVFFLEVLGKNPFPSVFHLLEAAYLCWLSAPFSIFKASSVMSSSLSNSDLLPSSFSYKDPHDYIVAHLDNPG